MGITAYLKNGGPLENGCRDGHAATRTRQLYDRRRDEVSLDEVERIRTKSGRGMPNMLARQIAIGFGVAIVFPLLVYYGVSTFSHAPKWEDFHEQYVYKPKPTPEELSARQEKQKDENAAFKEANRVFSLRLLCVAAPLGYLAIILGSIGVSGLPSGLIFGGILTVTIGYWWHWDYVEDWLRFVSLLVAMAVLVFISYWRFRRPRIGGDSSAS